MQSNSWGNTQQRWTASGFPFTIFVMVAMFVTALLSTIAAARPLIGGMIFVAPNTLSHPWTLLTYPLVGTPMFFSLLFDIGLTYFFCSSIERAWGTKAFALFFISIGIVSALSLCVGASLLKAPLFADNLFPVVGAAVVWGLLNADERMSLFFLPMRGIYFAGLAVLYIMFNYAQVAGWGAVPFALVGCAVAYAWLKGGVTYQIQSWGDGLIPMSRPAPRPGAASRPRLKLVPDQNKPLDDKFTLRDLNPFEWYAKRKRRKQFEKLVGGDD